MKVKELLHKIPEEYIILFILSMLAVLVVYFVTTVNTLNRKIDTNRIENAIQREELMKRSRVERLEDMTAFFNTNQISCQCEN